MRFRLGEDLQSFGYVTVSVAGALLLPKRNDWFVDGNGTIAPPIEKYDRWFIFAVCSASLLFGFLPPVRPRRLARPCRPGQRYEHEEQGLLPLSNGAWLQPLRAPIIIAG